LIRIALGVDRDTKMSVEIFKMLLIKGFFGGLPHKVVNGCHWGMPHLSQGHARSTTPE
jgi:hypothetical protein